MGMSGEYQMRDCRLVRCNIRTRSCCDMVNTSVFWLCHISCASSAGLWLVMAPPFFESGRVETGSENRLDAMDFRGSVARGNPGDLSDRGRIHALEIEQDHLPVERIEALNQLEQLRQQFTSLNLAPAG